MNLPASAICPVVNRVLETMFFCEAAYRGAARVDQPSIGARLSFSGDLNGLFRMVVGRRAAVQLAADFLGTSAGQVTESQVRATVSELANVTCGAAMGGWMPEATVHFSVPVEMMADDLARDCPHAFSILDETPELAVDVEIGGLV